MEPYELSISELREKLRKKDISSVEATESVLGRISEVEPRVDAYLEVTAEAALDMARRADLAIGRGEDGLLLGVPIGVKDIINTEGIPTTAGSRILEGFRPTYDASVTAKLKEAGAVITGKLNLDEFAMGSTTEGSGYKPTKNPWDLERVPGGSSGGSAAAVAAGECLGALGTDTGGSIRQPAAWCGLVGIKPTYGRVSRYGVIAFASSLDQVGPIARTTRDAAIMLRAIAGFDPLDSTSVNKPAPDYEAVLGAEVKGMKVGVPCQYFAAGLDPEVEARVRDAISRLEELGVETIPIDLPHAEYGVACYYIIAPCEASSNLARYDGVRYGPRVDEGGGLIGMYRATRDKGFGPEVKRRVLIGTYALSAGYYDAYYLKACRVRTLIKNDFDRAFQKVDAVVCPTTPTPAFKLGEKSSDPLSLYMSDVLTLSCNLAGLPGMSVPCGFTGGGLPVGMQIMARHFQEEVIFKLAHAYESASEWSSMRPPL